MYLTKIAQPINDKDRILNLSLSNLKIHRLFCYFATHEKMGMKCMYKISECFLAPLIEFFKMSEDSYSQYSVFN